MVQLVIAFAALSLIGAEGAHRMVAEPLKCPEVYRPPTLEIHHRPTSSEIADMMERGAIPKGEHIQGRAAFSNGQPICDFGFYQEPMPETSDPCVVDPHDGTQFLCPIDERLAPVNPR